MVQRRVWLGSTGPFFYDDAVDLLSVGALPAGTDQHAIVTEGQLYVNTAPTASQHVARRMDLLDLVWPVGSVFIAVVATNPNTLLGGGTWAAFGTGRVLVGINAADVDFDTVEEIGGAKTVASAGTVGAVAATGTAAVQRTDTGLDTAAQGHTHPAPTFTGSATSVVQPYIVVHMWKRTA